MVLSRPERNKNPGDLDWTPYQAKTFGATSDGRFAIYPDASTGFAALCHNCFFIQRTEVPKTLHEFGLIWSPPYDNNGATNYGDLLAEQMSLDPLEPFTVSADNLNALAIAISKNEDVNSTWLSTSVSAGVERAISMEAKV